MLNFYQEFIRSYLHALCTGYAIIRLRCSLSFLLVQNSGIHFIQALANKVKEKSRSIMELHTGQVKSYFSQCMPLYDEIISSFSSKGKLLQTTINKIFNPVYKRYSVSEYI